jgi:hypothetical protein
VASSCQYSNKPLGSLVGGGGGGIFIPAELLSAPWVGLCSMELVRQDSHTFAQGM